MDRRKEMEKYMDKEYPTFPNVKNYFIIAFNDTSRNGFEDGVKWADEHLPEPWEKTKEADYFIKNFWELARKTFIIRIKATHEIRMAHLVPAYDEVGNPSFRVWHAYFSVPIEEVDYYIAFS